MIFDKVAEILGEHIDADASTITMESTFEDLGLDSLDVVDLVMNFEDEFGVEIEMNENIKTVGNLVTLIESLKA